MQPPGLASKHLAHVPRPPRPLPQPGSDSHTICINTYETKPEPPDPPHPRKWASSKRRSRHGAPFSRAAAPPASPGAATRAATEVEAFEEVMGPASGAPHAPSASRPPPCRPQRALPDHRRAAHPTTPPPRARACGPPARDAPPNSPLNPRRACNYELHPPDRPQQPHTTLASPLHPARPLAHPTDHPADRLARVTAWRRRLARVEAPPRCLAPQARTRSLPPAAASQCVLPWPRLADSGG